MYPVPAPYRATGSASRGAVWAAASVPTALTIADLKNPLVQIQKVPQSMRCKSKAPSPGWVPQLCSCRLRDVFVCSLTLGGL